MVARKLARGALLLSVNAAVIGTFSAIPATGASSSTRASRHRSRTTAFAHLYWSEPEAFRGPSGKGIDNIWRANLKGTSVNRHFITGLVIPTAVAVGGKYLYWLDVEAFPSVIGRADLNGTHVDRSFIDVDALAEDIAVNSQHIYWISGGASDSPAEIWRADLNGSHRQKLVSVGKGRKGFYIGGLAVDDAHIYWVNTGTDTIGRANLNGTRVKLRFITGLNGPAGLALGREYLYWASTPSDGRGGSIGRADLSGGGVRPHFISGANEPSGVAVGAGHLYWTNNGTIARARLDGTHVQPKFIHARVRQQGTDVADPGDVAVGP